MLKLFIAVQSALAGFADDLTDRLPADERGQGTAEYALVLLVAAGVAFIVAKYFSSGGGKGLLETLMGAIIGKLSGAVGGLLK